MNQHHILLQALQEHLEEAAIPTTLETGSIWGHTGDIPHLEVYGDLHFWTFDADGTGAIIWLAWFDVKEWQKTQARATTKIDPYIREEWFEAPEDPNYLQRIEKRIRELTGLQD